MSMKAIRYMMLITLLPVYMAAAGDKSPAEADEWMKQAMAKTRQRAEEARQHHANTERFEQKYGWAKEKHPDLYAAMMTANQKAAESWATVVSQGETATHPDTLAAAKQAASVAAAEAQLAEMSLKHAAAAAERRHMSEKTGSAEVSALAAQLDANENALLAANRARNEASAAEETLQNENRALNKALHEAYKQARSTAMEAKSTQEAKPAKDAKQDKSKQE